MESDSNAEDDSAQSSKAELVRAKLRLIAHYAMLGFAPVVAVLALAVALVANHDQSARALHGEHASPMDASLPATEETRDDVESLKIALARERSVREEERKKAEGREKKIVQAISSLQAKMKITPTLEEQLRQAAHVPAAASAVGIAASAPAASAPVAASAPAAIEKKSAAPAPAHTSATTDEKTAVPAPAHAPAITEKKPAVTPPAPKKTEKYSSQVEAMKKAIEQYNKK